MNTHADHCNDDAITLGMHCSVYCAVGMIQLVQDGVVRF